MSQFNLGQFELFAVLLKEKIQEFQPFNLLVVFDGAEPEIKVPLRVTRETDKIRTVYRTLTTSKRRAFSQRFAHCYNPLLPPLVFSTFLTVLEELNIRVYVNDFEADRCIAQIAREYGAFVLSQDSDFFIYDVPNGYVPLDSLSIKTRSNVTYLTGRIYYSAKLAEHLMIPPRLLPLLASCIGNDYSENQLSLLDLSSFPSGTLLATSSKPSQPALIRFLAQYLKEKFLSMASGTPATDSQTPAPPSSDENSDNNAHLVDADILALVRLISLSPSKLLESVSQYSLSSTPMFATLFSKTLSVSTSTLYKDQFLNLLYRGRINHKLYDVYYFKTFYCTTTMEDTDRASSYDSSSFIRRLMYSCLRVFLAEENWAKDSEGMIEYKRKGSTRFSSELMPFYESDGDESVCAIIKKGVPVPTTLTTHQARLEQAHSILSQAIQAHFFDSTKPVVTAWGPSKIQNLEELVLTTSLRILILSRREHLADYEVESLLLAALLPSINPKKPPSAELGDSLELVSTDLGRIRGTIHLFAQFYSTLFSVHLLCQVFLLDTLPESRIWQLADLSRYGEYIRYLKSGMDVSRLLLANGGVERSIDEEKFWKLYDMITGDIPDHVAVVLGNHPSQKAAREKKRNLTDDERKLKSASKKKASASAVTKPKPFSSANVFDILASGCSFED